MPRVPSIKTRDQVSTNVPRMAATPANTATTGAIGKLAGTASKLALQIASKQQDQKDSTSALDLGDSIQKASSDYESTNSKNIDMNGAVGGKGDYTGDLEANLRSIRDAKLESSNGNVRSNVYEKMKRDRDEYIKRTVDRARKVQDSKSSAAAIQHGKTIIEGAKDRALGTGSEMGAYQDLANIDTHIRSTSSRYGTPAEAEAYRKQQINDISSSLVSGQIYNGKTMAALKTAGLMNDPAIQELLSDKQRETLKNTNVRDLGGNISAAKKIRLKNQAIGAIKAERAIAREKLRTGINTLSKAVMIPGAIKSHDEAISRVAQLNASIADLDDEEQVKYMNDATKILAISKVSESMRDLPPNEWGEVTDDSLSAFDDNTLEGATAKAETANQISKMKASYGKAMEKNFADFSGSIDGRIEKLQKGALDFNNPEGFAKYYQAVLAKADLYGFSKNNVKVLPTVLKDHYSKAINSGNTHFAGQALKELKQHVGPNNYMKALQEINPSGNVAVSSNIADEKRAKDLLTISTPEKQTELNNAWSGRVKTDESYKMNFKKFNKEVTDNDFFDALSQMNDNGKTFLAHQKAAESLYKQSRLRGESHKDASESVIKAMTDKFEVATNNDGNRKSLVVIPKDSGIDSTTVEKAMETIQADPAAVMSYLGLPNRVMNGEVTLGEFSDKMSFKASSDGTGVTVYDATGVPLTNDKRKPVTLTWDEVNEISNVQTEEFEWTMSNPFPSYEGSKDTLVNAVPGIRANVKDATKNEKEWISNKLSELNNTSSAKERAAKKANMTPRERQLFDRFGIE